MQQKTRQRPGPTSRSVIRGSRRLCGYTYAILEKFLGLDAMTSSRFTRPAKNHYAEMGSIKLCIIVFECNRNIILLEYQMCLTL